MKEQNSAPNSKFKLYRYKRIVYRPYKKSKHLDISVDSAKKSLAEDRATEKKVIFGLGFIITLLLFSVMGLYQSLNIAPAKSVKSKSNAQTDRLRVLSEHIYRLPSATLDERA